MLPHRLNGGHLYDLENAHIKHHVDQALRAHAIFKRDVDYMVKDGEVVIVDEFTGRLMPGRRWSDGLHQAVEAKEKVKIERENQTLATVTFQNYFRKYKKLVRHDRHRRHRGRRVRQDLQPRRRRHPAEPAAAAASRIPDLVYRTEQEKWDAIVTEIIEEHEKGRPVLVGTVSIEKSEKLSTMLDRRGLKRGTTTGGGIGQARRAEREVPRAGSRVRRAGRPQGRGHDRHQHGRPRHRHPARRQPRVHGAAAVRWPSRSPSGCRRARSGSSTTSSSSTSSTSTRFYRVAEGRLRADLRALQGADATPSTTRSSRLGGLHIVGTERHEARRIDNQLRGRAGRQGDPGSSRFYLSLEDDLMRIFGSDRISGLMQQLGMEEGVPIEHGMVTTRHRARAEAGRGAELLRPQTPARVRRRDEQAAREHLRAAPRRCSRARSGSGRGRRGRGRSTRAST